MRNYNATSVPGSSSHAKIAKRQAPPGSSPDLLAADPRALPTTVEALLYGPDTVERVEITDIDSIDESVGREPVTWIRAVGLADIGKLEAIRNAFGISGLSLADVVGAHQRPKTEQFDQHLFIVGRVASYRRGLQLEQLGMFLGSNYLLTFEEQPSEWLDPIVARITQRVGQIRERGADYLAYALLDALVDSYFPVLERYGESLDSIEDRVIAKPGLDTLSDVHVVKRDLLSIRRAIWPLREALNSLIRDASPFIEPDTFVYLRDCYDHTIQVIDIAENFRELGSDLTDVYLSSVSNRMNEVMKVLTIIATIFIPLSFIAGVWGMNFKHMPELQWRYGYLFALASMAIVAILMLVYFKRRGWLRRGR